MVITGVVLYDSLEEPYQYLTNFFVIHFSSKVQGRA